MKNMIEELWYGNIDPQAFNPHKDPEYKETCKELNELDEKLKPLLSEKIRELIEERQSVCLHMTSIEERQIFTYGFTLGARLMIDVFANDGK